MRPLGLNLIVYGVGFMVRGIFKWLLLTLPFIGCFVYLDRNAITSSYYRIFTDYIEIPIVHINDSHANYFPINYMGVEKKMSPFSLIKGFYNEEKKANSNALFVSAGDTMEKGSVADFLSKGQSTIEIFEKMGFDYLTLGNHDFAYGIEQVSALAERGAETTLTANLRVNADIPWSKPYAIERIAGVNIAFIGLTAAPYNEKNVRFDGPVYDDVDMLERYDFVDITREYIDKVRDDADVIILLSHLGLSADMNIAKAVSGIDLIIGGHSHNLTFFKQEVMKTDTKSTYVVQSASRALFAGVSRLWFDPHNKELVYIDYKPHWVHPFFMEIDETIEAFVASVLDKYAPDWDRAVCMQTIDLTHQQLSDNVLKASLNTFNADAAFIATNMVMGISNKGHKSQQDFMNQYFVEVQAPGTQSGWSSLYELSLSGDNLRKIIEHVKEYDLIKFAPDVIDNDKNYSVITHKKFAYNLAEFFDGAEAESSNYQMEMFELMLQTCTNEATPWSTPL